MTLSPSARVLLALAGLITTVLLSQCGKGLLPLSGNPSESGESLTGQLDVTFGVSGLVLTPIDTSLTTIRQITGIALYPDGRIATVTPEMVVSRYLSDGTLDTTWSGDGFVSAGVTAGEAKGIAVQTDGKVVAGGTFIPAFRQFGLARFLTDGSLDATFNGTGLAIATFGDGNNFGKEIAIQSDGKIVMGGYADTAAGVPTLLDVAIARFLTDGTLDATFSGDGRVTTNISGASDESHGLAIRSDGSIVASAEDTDLGIFRVDTAGVPDVTCDGDGQTLNVIGVPFRDNNAVRAQPDGKVVMMSWGFAPSVSLFLVRYTTNCALDTTFGQGVGMVVSPLDSFPTGQALALQTDGKIVVAGSLRRSGVTYALIARYLTDGNLDSSFGGNGYLTPTIGTSATARAVAIQPDGKIVVGGETSGSTGDVFLIRIHP